VARKVFHPSPIRLVSNPDVLLSVHTICNDSSSKFG
jgi:hypothetical protein